MSDAYVTGSSNTICVAIGKQPLPGENVVRCAMAMGGNFGVLPMNSMNRIVRIPIKDFIGLLTLTIVNSNVRSPMQSSTTKE